MGLKFIVSFTVFTALKGLHRGFSLKFPEGWQI